MNPKEIDRLGAEAFARELIPLKRWPHKPRAWPVLSLDTEYTREAKLVCWQTADGIAPPELHTGALSVDALADATRRARGTSRDVVVVTYFSLAELQFLPVFAEAFKIREYARGSLDCTLTASCGTRLHIYDVARYFDGMGLAAASRDLGLEQEKLSYDVTHVTHESLRDQRFIAYALRDAEVTLALYERMRSAWEAEGVDLLRTRTPAACAAARFRGHYLTEPVGLPGGSVRSLGLRAAWGGRAEAFARGEWPRVWEYDLSSAYPSAAISLRVMPRARDWRPLRSLSGAARAWRGGFVRVSFAFPRTCLFPSLPVFDDGTLLYPREGHSYCTLHEALAARRQGARLRLYDGHVFRAGTTALADMMGDLLGRRRATTEPAERRVLKLAANSLIGKFVQHRLTPGAADVETVALSLGVPISALAGLGRTELIALGWEPACKIGSSWAPEWNALITGHVRAQLGEAIVSTSPVYCATDAVWTTAPWDDAPPAWELKREGPALVARTRLGILGEKTVHHAWASREAATRALRAGVAGADYQHRRPLHFVEALRKRKTLGTWVSEARKGSTRWDGKRELLLDGTTLPWQTVQAWREDRGPAWAKVPLS